MEDRLVWLLRYFDLQARVFHSGPLCRTASYDEREGLGYIHVLRRGPLSVQTRGQQDIRLTEPSLLFYMRPTSHRLQPLADETETVCASFDFGCGLKNPLFDALPGLIVLPLKDAPTLDTVMQLLFKEAEENHCGRQAVLNKLIEITIIQLLRDLMDQSRLSIGILAGLADARLVKAINAIHAEPAVNWKLEGMAAKAGMSRAAFASHFRKLVGMTPANYLAQWRIGVAQSMLKQGKPMQYVADAVGYANASALSRAFSAHVGLTPKEWKKQYAG